MIDRESLAKAIHESARAAVESGNTVAADKHGEKTFAFIEWDDLSESAREGKRMQADFLLDLFEIHTHTAEDRDKNMALLAVLKELHRAQAKSLFGNKIP